jgi:hypothetical protein
MRNFEGTWESTWLGINPQLPPNQQIGMGIDSLLRIGQRENFIYYSGKGNQTGLSADDVPIFEPQWNTHARTDFEERLLIGRFWNPIWNQFTNNGGLLDKADRESFLNQSGQFFFELSEDRKTFTGGYNVSSQPTHWFAWDGRKISHNPRYRKTFNPLAFPRDVTNSVVTPPPGLF